MGSANVRLLVAVGRGIVVGLSICMDRALLPPRSLWMVEAFWVVGEN